LRFPLSSHETVYRFTAAHAEPAFEFPLLLHLQHLSICTVHYVLRFYCLIPATTSSFVNCLSLFNPLLSVRFFVTMYTYQPILFIHITSPSRQLHSSIIPSITRHFSCICCISTSPDPLAQLLDLLMTQSSLPYSLFIFLYIFA